MFTPKKTWKKKKRFYRKNCESKHFIFINIITRFCHHADSLQEICIQPFKVLFWNYLNSSHPVLFFLFHCINKREVRPASLRSRSFRASSPKRLLSYTFITYTGFDSTRHLHICKHTPRGSPSSIREFLNPQMALSIKDLNRNSSHRFKKIHNRWIS